MTDHTRRQLLSSNAYAKRLTRTKTNADVKDLLVPLDIENLKLRTVSLNVIEDRVKHVLTAINELEFQPTRQISLQLGIARSTLRSLLTEKK